MTAPPLPGAACRIITSCCSLATSAAAAICCCWCTAPAYCAAAGCRWYCAGADVPRELLARGGDLLSDLAGPALEERDVRDAAVHGVAEARVSLVRQRRHGVPALVRRQVAQDRGHVLGAEHAVHVGELARAVRREVGREDATLRALAPQLLAPRARRARRRRHGCLPAPPAIWIEAAGYLRAGHINIRRK
jgi:hypothetical protein